MITEIPTTKMKNKTILSVSMWLLVVFWGIYYFVSQNIKREDEISSVEKSSHFLKDAIHKIHQDRYHIFLYHMGHIVWNNERYKKTFYNLENCYGIAELQYKKRKLSLNDFEENYSVESKIHRKFILENDSLIDYSIQKNNLAFKIQKLYLYQDLMNVIANNTYPNFSYWETGYSKVSIVITEDNKITMRVTDIFNPEPIEYYLK